LGEDEIILLLVSLGVALCCAPFVLGWLLHRLFFRANAAAGVPILAVAASLAWIVYVLRFHADPSVVGVYSSMYFVLGAALVLGPGFWAPDWYGLRVSVDVFQRKNMAVAIVVGAFVLATGLIYGGCNWGEADPVGGDEGGWWIPLGFFLAGWLSLIGLSGIYLAGEARSLRRRLVQDRSLAEARSAASFLLGTALVLTHAVAGDFWGWQHGLLGVGSVVLMMVTHDLCRRSVPLVLTTAETSQPGRAPDRHLESLAYLSIGVAFWVLSFLLSRWMELPPF